MMTLIQSKHVVGKKKKKKNDVATAKHHTMTSERVEAYPSQGQ